MVSISKRDVISFVPTNVKTLEFQNNDTETRVCSMAAYLPPNAVGIVIASSRASGSGSLYVYPNSGAQLVAVATLAQAFLYGFAEGTLDFKFKNAVANDDWDVYILGYFIKGPVGK